MNKRILDIIEKVKELFKDDKRFEWNEKYYVNPSFLVRNDKMVLNNITFDWCDDLTFHERLCVYPNKIIFSSILGTQEVLMEYKNWNELLSK